MKKILETCLKILAYGTFFVPLLVFPSSFIFPFIVPKILVFRSLVELMCAGYCGLLIINWKEYVPKRTNLTIAVVLFLVSFLLSTFFGVDSYHSFWDNHERMLGLFTLAHYVVYYLMITSLFKNWADWKRALNIFLIAGSVVMAIGVLQVFLPDLLLNQGSLRVASSLGNSIYVGGYGLFLTAVSCLLLLKEKTIGRKIVYALAGVLALLGLVFSGTRGSMLGLVAGIMYGVTVYSFVLKEYPRVRHTLWISGGVLVALVVLLFFNRDSNFVHRVVILDRTFNTSLNELVGGPRIIAWKIALESFKDHPLFGWGPNNFFYAFNQHYNPRSLEFGYSETWFDNAHNILVNTLAVQGVIGLVTYIAIFVVAIWILYSAYAKKTIDAHMLVIGSVFLIAHLVQNITVFENPTSYLYFMFWLAFINSVSYKSSTFSLKEDVLKKIIPASADAVCGTGTLVVLGVVGFCAVFIFNLQPARANTKTLHTLVALGQNPNEAFISMQEALAFSSPHIDDIRNDISRGVYSLLSNNYQKIGKEKSNQILDLMILELEKNLVLHPLDVRVHLSLSQLMQLGLLINNDPKYLAKSEFYLEQALAYSPRRQQLVYNLVGVKAQLGKWQDAVKLLEAAISDNPRIAESYWRLAYVYKITQQLPKVDEVMLLAKKNEVLFTDQEKNILKQIGINSTTPISSTVK